MTSGSATVPGSVIGWEDSELSVEFEYRAGSAPSGLSGPPEDYDPGEGPEIESLTATIEVHGEKPTPVPLNEEDEQKVIDWLYENGEFPDDEPDEPDWDPGDDR